MKKITIVSFVLFLVSIVVSTATVTSLILELSNELIIIGLVISVPTLIISSLISLPNILGFYLTEKS